MRKIVKQKSQLMTFRANEEANASYEEMENYLVNPRIFPTEQQEKSLIALREITKNLGPVVSSYPTWHPLVNTEKHRELEITYPRPECGYEGLDHTLFFVNGFITCPYGSPDKVIESVKKIKFKGPVEIHAEALDFPLYTPNGECSRSYPVLVTCEWDLGFFNEFKMADGTIALERALPLLLNYELQSVERAQVAETWKTMAPYFLGTPCGAASSQFINLKNGRAMKRVWEALIGTGIYGPIKQQH